MQNTSSEDLYRNEGSEEFLNAFEVVDPKCLRWKVRVFGVSRVDGRQIEHDERSAFRGNFFDLRKQNSQSCPGYGFIVDVGAGMLIVPERWRLPESMESGKYRYIFNGEITTDPSNPAHWEMIQGLLREGIKRHLKDKESVAFGGFWQDYNAFCQFPNDRDEDFSFCRRFEVSAKVVRGGRWLIQMVIGTAVLDGKTLDWYYHNGRAAELATAVRARLDRYMNRKNEPGAIRFGGHPKAASRGRVKTGH